MSQWLDDLSEDWEPEPRSSSPKSSQPTTAILRNSGSRRTDGTSKRKSVLTERSYSEENIQFSSVRREPENAPRLGLSRRSVSAESNQSHIQHGTTARISPSKPRQQSDTPEWKRRLLRGEMGYGEQKDLFSPMGIQNIFQRPSQPPPRPQPQERNRGLSFLKSLESVPSSPPPWPSNADNTNTSSTRFGTTRGRNLEALDEQEEDGSQEQMRPENGSISDDGQNRREVGHHSGPAEEDMSFDQASLRGGRHAFDSIRLGHTSQATAFGASLLSKGSESRKPSNGQSIYTNGSDFSPVYISKHNTADGKVDYAAIDLSKTELADHLRQMTESRASRQSTASRDKSLGSADLSALVSETELPEDLSVGTPDIASMGDFVSVKRGGYSQDGSFRRRPLSPSPLARPLSASTEHGSVIHHSVEEPSDVEPSLPVPPYAPTPPHHPTTPKRPPANGGNDFLSPERNKSSNSPLKLFGNHDTFTTNKLHRRISQLEDSIHQAQNHDSSKNLSAAPSRRITGSRLPSVEEASITKEHAALKPSDASVQRSSSIDGYFGRGELDQYSFPEDQYSNEQSVQSEMNQSMPSRSPSPDALPPGSQQPFKFYVEESPEPQVADTFRGKRKLSKVSAKSTFSTLSVTKRSDRGERPTLGPDQFNADLSKVPESSMVSEGKRPPTSPFKNPTPKRRRTLVQIEVQEASITSIHDSHHRFQTAIGKRKDARYDSRSNIADPDVLARRTILRPRNPTPSQRRRQEIEDEIYDVAEEFVSSSPRLEAIKEHLSVPSQIDESQQLLQARAVASEVAAFSVKVAHGMKDDGRKRSVTTQDFLDEAMKIMSFIRSKGRPASGLGSVAEFESEVMLPPVETRDDSGGESPLNLSRPPSREGKKSGWRSRELEIDPDVEDHLRKFQEQESDVFMDSSVRSSRVPTLESQPPGLQIIERSTDYQSPRRSRSHSNATRDAFDSTGTNGTGIPSRSSQTSMNSSLGRTTGSRKSDNVATLAPDAIAHLIPEEVAGMTFDREKGIWTKAKSPRKERKINDEPASSLTQSENDPFDSIPDLSVNEAEETRHLLLSKSASGTEVATSDDAQPTQAEPRSRSPTPLKPADSSPTQPQVARYDSGSQEVSLVSMAPPRVAKATTIAKTAAINAKDGSEEVEHEIQIHEDRTVVQESHKRHEIRNITVSIASPSVSRQQNGTSKHCNPPIISKGFGRNPKTAISERLKPQESRQLNLSVDVTGPVAKAVAVRDELEQVLSSPYRADVTFYMSDLPDFTVNQIDERELPDRTIMKRTAMSRVGTIEDRFASGNHLLVKALQDAEPEEPFWEDLRQVNLHGKGVTSLHLLDLLCDRLEKINVADNQLSQLGGAPSTLRCMNLQGNQLTSLTSWGHLMNLQYLDVSSNQIESLEGLSCLIHLRELRADDNKIWRLSGIESLDGLLTLSLRNNKLQQLDFGESELTRLSTIDFRGNELSSITGLDCLPALTDLNLDDNDFDRFPMDQEPCHHLTSLSMQRNRLTSLELAKFSPRLQHLHIDGNRLPTTSGIAQLKHLRILAMRSQAPPEPCDLKPLLTSTMRELHTLCLSQNHIPTLFIPRDFNSIQHIELASCGLNALPNDFGLSIPNLRTLNLNFNAIKDIRPLLNIRQLNTLLLSGLRVSRLRKTTTVLSKLSNLETLDLRDNPFSLGYYPKPVEQRLVPQVTTKFASNGSESETPPSDEEPILFTMPPCSKDVDRAYLDRLDEGTKLRRRVYELLLANHCRNLTILDGMSFERKDVLVKDHIWDRLLALGVMKRSSKTATGVDVESDDANEATAM